MVSARVLLASTWLNYIAFLPMSWLLLGIYAIHQPQPSAAGLVGAIVYGVAFTFFAHTTLFAMSEGVPTYELLWDRLGSIYTVHGAFMVCGGLMFALSAIRAGWLPRWSVVLFAAGLLTNLMLSLLPTPDMLQTFGSAVRNAGLMGMDHAILWCHTRVRPNSPEGP